MKKLLIIVLIIPFLGFSQEFKSQELRYKHKSNNQKPEWVKLMYNKTSNPDLVTKAYGDYYQLNAFVKNSDTQYYKRWLRAFSRDNSSQLADEKINEAKYIQNSLNIKNAKSPTSQWEGIGPIDFDKESISVSYAAGAGHVYTIEQSMSDDSVLYCGTATAGVWKTTNKGGSWFPVTNDLIVNSVEALEIDPIDNDIVYFGSKGRLYKSIDGGSNWLQIGDATFNLDEHYIPEIKIHPNNNQLLFVCSDKGFFRSVDGGSNFIEVLDGDFQEMEFHPTNPDTCYIIKQINDKTEFYKSIDGGQNFTLKTVGWPVPAVGDEQKRTEIATTPNATHKVYALCTGEANGGSGLYGIYISNDMGETWNRTCCGPQEGGPASTTNMNLTAWSDLGDDDGGQFYYDLALEVADDDSNKVFVGAVNLWISNDGGATFTCPSKWSHSYKTNYVHADIHDLKIIGNDFWLASDGGSFYSSNKGDTINRKMLGIEATDFWGFGAGFWDGEVIIGGTYHNGTLLKDNDVYLNGWLSTGGGDNIRGFVNPGNERKVIHDYGAFNLSGDRNLSFTNAKYDILPNASYTIGESSNIEFHPNSHNTSYVGEDGKLWLTEDAGDNFELVNDFGNVEVTSIKVAFSDPSVIYVATFPAWWDKKHIWKSVDTGSTWVNITPNASIIGSEDWIPYDITVNDKNPNEIWVARTTMSSNYGTYDGTQVIKSIDGGQTWINYSTSTLDGEFPTNIEFQRGTNGGVYLGTRRAVYYRNNTMNDWELFNNNLPLSTTSVKLIPYYKEGKVRNGTNRSAYECVFYEPSKPSAQIAVDQLETYCPGDDVQFFNRSAANEKDLVWSWTFEGGTPATSSNRNPFIRYDAHGEFDVTLTVTDTFGTSTQVLTDFIVVENCFGASVDENEKYDLDIYPTIVTSNSIIKVHNPLNQKLIYKLYSSKGRMIDYQTISNNQIKIGDLSSGTYFIRLQGDKNMINRAIVVR